MAEQDSLNSELEQKGWRKAFSSHSGTIVFAGLIALGFLIAWVHGGFPSILLPSFIILAIGLLSDLFTAIARSTPKKRAERVEPLKAVFFLIVFFLIFAWMGGALLALLGGPTLNTIFYKVEFPFSEATHVVADSEGSVYVYSTFSKRIQKYNKDGRFEFGWFATNAKFPSVAIDVNDSIYIQAASSLRQYDNSGSLIGDISIEPEGSGWWRFRRNSFIWDLNAKEPERYDEYQQVVKDGDLLPSTELRKTGFKTADGKYYKLTRLWYLFPVVSVERYLSEFEGYILPNPLSLTFTFVFPGFLFYILALIMVWIFEKQARRLARLKRVLVTVAIFIIAGAAIVIGGSVVMFIANALPKSSSMHFWLVPLVVIPYWIAVVITALWAWRSLLERLNRSGL
ncbi:MAG TPA: hypothetical protein VMX13_01100 [Sedimentisphaerales bacterium]|nr:hypothetical protein [Sedimentisphaerales bacterium]